MTSPRHIPIFDGHNDVLLRLYRRGGTDAPRAFLEGEGKGQLDLPTARQGDSLEGCSRSLSLRLMGRLAPMAKHLLKTSAAAPRCRLPLN
jgi:hypothetical protein